MRCKGATESPLPWPEAAPRFLRLDGPFVVRPVVRPHVRIALEPWSARWQPTSWWRTGALEADSTIAIVSSRRAESARPAPAAGGPAGQVAGGGGPVST